MAELRQSINRQKTTLTRGSIRSSKRQLLHA